MLVLFSALTVIANIHTNNAIINVIKNNFFFMFSPFRFVYIESTHLIIYHGYAYVKTNYAKTKKPYKKAFLLV